MDTTPSKPLTTASSMLDQLDQVTAQAKLAIEQSNMSEDAKVTALNYIGMAHAVANMAHKNMQCSATGVRAPWAP